MSLSKEEFSRYIRAFNFRELFNEMGWNNDRTQVPPISVDGQTFRLQSVAEKSGFRILVCSGDSGGGVPDYNARKSIDTKITKLFQEHLIIFHDTAKTEQLWQLLVRRPGRPVRISETRWKCSQEAELLFQRASGVVFELDEEDKITIVDVTARIDANFIQNNEKVTRKFYEHFKKEHASFYEFVAGIDDHIDEWNRRRRGSDMKENRNKQWYVSLMLNRLMFCYFIQKKGFLDENKNYLRDKLKQSKNRRGQNQYYSFYRDFLLALFHKGLGEPNHSQTLQEEIGSVPYLNGGLFDEHLLEEQYKEIRIDDEAFERIFDFFDQYEWHLDTRHAASGRDINPDVIGYIFEKYINDRAAMGAYYTKEDITDYISKNCILPYLIEETRQHYPKAFGEDAEIWKMLRVSGDRYIYDDVKKGVELDLPFNIESGIDVKSQKLLERRNDWNKSATEEFALPTETWREVVNRRKRYGDLKSQISSGKIVSFDELVKNNLNVQQFVLDIITNTNDSKLLEHFYKSMAGHVPRQSTNDTERRPLAVLDPTCGSGAFLFAAMNILEELYMACLQRMENFVDDEGRAITKHNGGSKHDFGYFEHILTEIRNTSHPNREYFVYKSIILRNLYGVDIMKEAVEVAKLRLFLKLIALVDPDFSAVGHGTNLGLEPLPDIDFNIRPGNSLVGFVNQQQVESLSALLLSDGDKSKLIEQCEKVAKAFETFKRMQLSEKVDFEDFKASKDELNVRLRKLTNLLNRAFFAETSTETSDESFSEWLESYRPFHWFAEFYEIVQHRGGFDVIIGNPPYIEYSKVSATYEVRDVKTIECGNIYAFVVERSLEISGKSARVGFVVPISLTAAQRMAVLQNLIISASKDVYFSNFALRPAALFPGVMQRITIFIMSKGSGGEVFTTDYRTWYSDEREFLFQKLCYQELDGLRQTYSIPKVDNTIAHSALRALMSHGSPWVSHKQFKGDKVLYYHNAGGYWIKTFDFKPFYRSLKGGDKKHTTISELRLPDSDLQKTYLAILNSNIFYFYWKSTTDARHIYPSDIANFPIKLPLPKDLLSQLNPLLKELMTGLRNNSARIIYGNAEVDQFSVFPCKRLIDEIDLVLAKHYGLSQEELDFIINYDIKYRAGGELDGDSE